MLMPQPSELGITGLYHHFQLSGDEVQKRYLSEKNQHKKQELELTE